MVKRQRCRDDSRAMLVEITDKGARLLELCREIEGALEREVPAP